MPDYVEVAFRDFDGTRKTSTIRTVATATSIQNNSLITALKIWSMGANDGDGQFKEGSAPSGLAAANPAAQESTQLIIEMQDSVNGRVYIERLPMPDVLMADDGGTDPAWIATGQGANSLTVANPAHDNYATLQTAIELVWESPNGNLGTMQRAFIEK